jgi:hypothetical protein
LPEKRRGTDGAAKCTVPTDHCALDPVLVDSTARQAIITAKS